MLRAILGGGAGPSAGFEASQPLWPREQAPNVDGAGHGRLGRRHTTHRDRQRSAIACLAEGGAETTQHVGVVPPAAIPTRAIGGAEPACDQVRCSGLRRRSSRPSELAQQGRSFHRRSNALEPAAGGCRRWADISAHPARRAGLSFPARDEKRPRPSRLAPEWPRWRRQLRGGRATAAAGWGLPRKTV